MSRREPLISCPKASPMRGGPPIGPSLSVWTQAMTVWKIFTDAMTTKLTTWGLLVVLWTGFRIRLAPRSNPFVFAGSGELGENPKLWRKLGIFDRLMKHVVDQCIAARLVQCDAQTSCVNGTRYACIHSLKEITLAPMKSIKDYLTLMARQDEGRIAPPRIPMMSVSRLHRPHQKSGGWKTKRRMKIFMAKPSPRGPGCPLVQKEQGSENAFAVFGAPCNRCPVRRHSFRASEHYVRDV